VNKIRSRKDLCAQGKSLGCLVTPAARSPAIHDVIRKLLAPGPDSNSNTPPSLRPFQVAAA
jgi:hypothetical protein